MPKSRSYPAQTPPSSRYNAAPQPWDALKNELEDLLGQVQDQILEFEDGDKQEQNVQAPISQAMNAASDLEMRRQEALLNVRTAVDRLGAKQVKPKKKSKKKKKRFANNDLEAAIAQIRASTGQMDANIPAPHIPSGMAHVQPQVDEAGIGPTHDFAELTGQIEGLHRSIRDLAGAVPSKDSFARIENQISNLSTEIDEHKSPQAMAISDQLDGLQYALERLAELQVRQIGHIEQIKVHEAKDVSDERQQRIEESIRSIYEKFDTLETSIDKPNSSIETIAKGIAGIARAVSDMQKRDANDQSHNILAQIENVSQRLSAMDNGQSGSLTNDVKREMQGLRGQLVNALEPRFTALESRLDDFAAKGQIPGGASDYQHVTTRIEEMEDRIARAIEGISTAQSLGGDNSGSPETFVMLKAMEARLAEALEELRSAGSVANGGAQVSLDALQAMEDRIAAAISRLPSNVQVANEDQYDGLRVIENNLSSSLRRLEALSASSGPVQKSVSAAEPVALTASAVPQRTAPTPAATTNVPPVDRANVTKSLQTHKPLQKQTPPAPTSNNAEVPPVPKSSFVRDDVAERSAPIPQSHNFEAEASDQKSIAQQSRESFIAAARRASVERHDTKPTPVSSGGLLGRAFDRIKSIKQDKQPSKDEPAETLRAEQPIPGQREPQVEQTAEILDEQEQASEDVRTLSVGPEPARPQSLVQTPKPHSTLADLDVADHVKKDPKALPEDPESFLTRNRQPILLAASIVAIIAMTANLVLDKGQDFKDVGIPSTVGSQDVGEAPRQISLTEVETALSNSQPMPTQTASLTSATSMIEQNVGLVAPTPQLVDTQTVTASIPNSPIEVALPPTELGPIALREAAANGDPRAQYEVGLIFAEGKAVPKDSQAAVKWFERSAASGFAAAQYRLGTAFEHGLGIEKNLDQAKLWYLRAAEAGNRMGMHNLAALYASGPDGERDFNAATRWFEEAAKRGVLDSQFNLGMLYARGLGVTQDFEQSYKWFSIAAANGDKDAQKARDDVARSLDPTQMSAIKLELAQWRAEPIDLASNFAPIGTWDKNFNPGAEIKQREVVMGVQIALTKLGFQLGTPDGVMGPNTRDAILEFERALGMNESGTINPRLLTVLNGQPV